MLREETINFNEFINSSMSLVCDPTNMFLEASQHEVAFFYWLEKSLLISGFLYIQIFDLFDVKRKGFIDFGDFVRALNVFHPNAPQQVKIDCKLKIEYSNSM